MKGRMMQVPLLTSDILKNAMQRYPDQQVVSRTNEGSIHRYTYADAYRRSCQLANALARLGVERGERVATLAWNNFRHLELYYGISGYGAVVHTLNARLFAEQLQYIINHAEDRLIFVDAPFLPMLEEVREQIPGVRGFIVNCDPEQMPETTLAPLYCYETLLAAESVVFDWPRLQATDASGLCYTSGTTGNPKGVLYDHHSSVLHAMMSGSSQYLDFSERSSVMPVVPMYHVCAWGVPFSAPLYGAKLVLPGPSMDGVSLQALIEQEAVDKAYAVPTVWLGLHNYLEASGKRIDSLKLVGVGGAASPRALVKLYAERYNVYWMGIWGMTETSPLATAAIPTPALEAMEAEARYDLQATAGRAMFGVEIEIFDANGEPAPHDGESRGNLRVRGPWVLASYFKGEGSGSFVDGWFDTGDVAVINPDGYLKIVDRSKDVIKSGGEWISSVDLENAALNYDAVNEACVIGARHEKWDERPIMLVTLKPGKHYDEAGLRAELEQRVAKWWMPDAIIVVDELPHTGTGKLRKVELRQDYAGFLINRQP
ncbi:long-chain fatty acid--CoA ligase [Aestuariirhabdus litorea]|uniref:Fatty-acid--CoA ligase n=1 Tax=Aestuariirhabdus litorea TaxID=2528527 RepID=A0A3P3VKM2_9GAMM|nr:long-chain fatty acid--CoA ligase [Aestuariirhabdus litorea]RRJ83240.1 fatty-acid--CoA ligase [Aestuariirhabdus litorea]RWW93397.1 long-chain-fatty-acid--CoA ligase [Endozoicomonadaceae bacterium GTF-13]